MVYANVKYYDNGLCMARIFPENEAERTWIFESLKNNKKNIVERKTKTDVEYYGIFPSELIKTECKELTIE